VVLHGFDTGHVTFALPRARRNKRGSRRLRCRTVAPPTMALPFWALVGHWWLYPYHSVWYSPTGALDQVSWGPPPRDDDPLPTL